MGNKDSKEHKKKPTPKTNGVVAAGSDCEGSNSGQDSLCVLPPGPFVNNGDFVIEIPDEQTWLAYKHEPSDRSFSHVSVVKVVVPVSTRVTTSQADIFFIQSDKWVFHWHFTRDILKDPGSQDLGDFNALNYGKDDRDFVCLTVTKYHDQGVYSFELAARDNYKKEKIASIYELLKRKCFFGDKLFYRPLSKLHDSIVKDPSLSEIHLPLIESDKLFGGIKYQPLTIGSTFGYLRLVRADPEHEEMDVDKARWNDILLCEGIPNDLPVISGLITSILQTPLCHVALLCGNRGTPNIASVGSFDDENLRALVGKPVKYTVRKADYVIEPSTVEEVDAWQTKAFNKLRKGTNIVLTGDVGHDQLVHFKSSMALKEMEYEIVKKSIGAKAINCLQLAKKKIGSDILNCAFVIPYFYYHDVIQRIFVRERSWHMELDGSESDKTYDKSSSLDTGASSSAPKLSKLKKVRPSFSAKKLMDDLLSDARQNATPDPKDYAKSCATIRSLIETYVWEDPSNPMSRGDDDDEFGEAPCESVDGLLDFLAAELERWKSSGVWSRCDGVIFRSSTNAEDIEGFNAAGLYESIPVSKVDLEGKTFIPKLLEALQRVWASVWSFRGFEERRLFGLDSGQVNMAILCQPWFNTAQRCNGVAITAHPTRHDFAGHMINLQVAGRLVTDSCGGARAEQHTIWTYGRTQQVVETMCLSSLSDKQLMEEDELQKLIPMLIYLDEQFGHNTPGTRSNIIQGGKKTKFCVDVEFLVMKDTSEIVILQCRPYKMIYEYDVNRNPPPKR